MQECKHIDQIVPGIAPQTPDGCEECLAAKQTWINLRLCLKCGHVGCCDSSPGHHASKHFHKTNHPIMAGYQTPMEFRWCFVDDMPV